jgi:hypothetical protein
MAIFCIDYCEAICASCEKYRDKYEGINRFAGEGICEVDGSEVDALDGFECDNFYCFLVNEDVNS